MFQVLAMSSRSTEATASRATSQLRRRLSDGRVGASSFGSTVAEMPRSVTSRLDRLHDGYTVCSPTSVYLAGRTRMEQRLVAMLAGVTRNRRPTAGGSAEFVEIVNATAVV
jgi:hypothetical protein